MFEELLEEIERRFPQKVFISIEEAAQFLDCEVIVLYNWNKRTNLKRRPPRIPVGKEIRYPKKEFVKWLANEQSRA